MGIKSNLFSLLDSPPEKSYQSWMKTSDSLLITGAGGLVGSALVLQLQKASYTNLLVPRFEELDLCNQQQTNDYFQSHQIDYVFHLAGHVGGIGGSVARPVEFLYENEMMALNTIHSAYKKSVKKLLFLGSSCVYPRLCPQPMKEEHLLTGLFEPTNEGYALAKISGLKLCEYFNKQYGTNFISLMPCNLYGFKDHFESTNSHVISALIYKFHQGKMNNDQNAPIWGSGKVRREFLFADDLAEAMIYFMSKYDAKEMPPFINVGTGVDMSILELAQLIKEIVGFKGGLQFDASKPDGIPQKLMDVSKANLLGWQAKTSLHDGLKKVYQNYLNNLNS